MDNLLDSWMHELNYYKVDLHELGDKPDSLQYKLFATEALRLAMCIIELQKVLTQDKEVR